MFENDNGFLMIHTIKYCLNVKVRLRSRETVAKRKFLSSMALSISFRQIRFVSRLHIELSHEKKLNKQWKLFLCCCCFLSQQDSKISARVFFVRKLKHNEQPKIPLPEVLH